MLRPVSERTTTSRRGALYLSALMAASFLIKGNIAARSEDRPLVWDEATYVQMAGRLAAARLSPAAFPGSHRAPGYPYFLAAVSMLAGPRIIFLLLAQVTVSVVSGWLLYRCVQRRHGEGRGLAAAGVFLLLPELVGSSVLLWAETLCILFLIPALDLTARFLEEGTRQLAVACAIAWGLTVLVRSGYEGVPVLLAALLVARFRTRSGLLVGTLFLASFLACLAPWMVRNKVLHGHLQIATNPWIVMWHGNRDLSTPVFGRYYAIPDEAAREAMARREALRWIRDQGWRWLPIKVHRTLTNLWGVVSFPLRNVWLGVDGPMTATRSRTRLALYAGSYVLVLALGIWGWSKLPADGFWWAGTVLIFYTSVQSLVMTSHARYRLPLLVPLIVFAIIGPRQTFRPVPAWRRALAVVLLAATAYAVAQSCSTRVVRDLLAGRTMRDNAAPGQAPTPLTPGELAPEGGAGDGVPDTSP